MYGSISIGILICFILITFTLVNHYRQNKNIKIRKKSSTTDETISSLAKQQEHIQHDDQDETNSSVDQYLIHEQFIHNHNNVRFFRFS